MNPVPEADVDITGDLVRRLLAEQHPDLAGLPLGRAANGWDNAVYRLGDGLAVRLPRREAAHRLLLGEQRWLPFLAPRLPVPVPAPVRRGRPGAGYPYHWSVVPWFDGASAATSDPGDRDAYAPRLAAFLRALHVPAPGDAPRNPVRGGPLAGRDASFRDRLAAWDAHRAEHAAEAAPPAAVLARVWEDALCAPAHPGPRLWLHGDLHPHNCVVAPDGTLAAVGDFGDLASGDPATDLAAAWLHFTPAGHAAFHDGLEGERPAVGHDPAVWSRARGWALHLGLVLALHGPSEPLHAVGVHALRRVAEAG